MISDSIIQRERDLIEHFILSNYHILVLIEIPSLHNTCQYKLCALAMCLAFF